MAAIAGLTYYELDFDADGTLSSDGGLPAAVQAGGIPGPVRLSHGWNDSVQTGARPVPGDVQAAGRDDRPGQARRRPSVGVIWPSLLFPEDDPSAGRARPSTGAAAGRRPGAGVSRRRSRTSPRMGTLLDQQPQDAGQLEEFHALASGLVTTPPLAPEDAGQQAAITGDTGAVFGQRRGHVQDARLGGAQGMPEPVHRRCGPAARKCCAACPTTR